MSINYRPSLHLNNHAEAAEKNYVLTSKNSMYIMYLLSITLYIYIPKQQNHI